MMIPKQSQQRTERRNASKIARQRAQLLDHYHALRATLNGGEGTAAMIELVHCYVVDGDVMACQCCGARLYVRRALEAMRHGTDEGGLPCPLAGTDNPWALWFQATDLVRGTAGANAAMRRALTAAAGRFREYEELHAAKPDPVKAQRNAEMAQLCEAALLAGGVG